MDRRTEEDQKESIQKDQGKIESEEYPGRPTKTNDMCCNVCLNDRRTKGM